MFIYDIIQAFCSLESQSEPLYNTSLLDTKNFLEQNFYNYKKFLTSRLKNNKKDVTPSTDKIENKGYYINYQQIELIASKNNNKHYLCLPQNPNAFTNTSKSEKMFNFSLLPSFIKDILPENAFSRNLPNFNFTSEVNAKRGYKFDIIISNKYNDFIKVSSLKTNHDDEIEANYDIVIFKFKEWSFGFSTDSDLLVNRLNLFDF